MTSLLDPNDEALWRELCANPSATNRAIGASLGITEVEVSQRLRRLDNENLVRLSAAVDVISAGYSAMAHIFIDCSSGDEQATARRLLASPLADRLLALHSIQGQSGLEATVRIIDVHDLAALVEASLGSFSHARTFTVDVAYDVLLYRADIMSPRLQRTLTADKLAVYFQERIIAHRLDELDCRIIAALHLDGRQSIREIARNHGVTEGGIRYRLRRLREKSLLHIAPVRHPDTLGIHHLTRLFIKVSAARIMDVVSHFPENRVLLAALSTGEANLHLVVSAPTLETLVDYISSIRKLDGVGSVKTSIMGDVYYFDTRWSFANKATPGWRSAS